MVINKGRMEEIAATDELFTNPQSAYTKKLIASIPQISIAQ
jgi:ABC-type oligopeptide transport system ATPase subunit